MKVPLSKPYLGEEEVQAVTEVIRSDRLALGPKTLDFEARFAEATGTKYAVSLNSGTSGLHLAVRALGIGKGDEVITSPFSFIASANCILFEGATPVFVDVEEETFNINSSLLSSAVTSRTKAILPVHVFGSCADMDPVLQLAKEKNLGVIEDACESIQALYKGKLAGSMGDMGVFGFYPNKQITTGEGGMVTTNNKEHYDYLFSARNQGRATDMQWLTHVRLGYNFRISEITAAIGVEQMKKLPDILRLRREKALLYNEALKDVPGIRLPKGWESEDHSWFVFAVRVEAKYRDEIIRLLNEQGVESKAYFYPCIHLQDFYMKDFGFKEGMFPIAEKLSKETLILPFFTSITEAEILYVKEKIVEAFASLRK